jgi:hypothetical protein
MAFSLAQAVASRAPDEPVDRECMAHALMHELAETR